MLVGILSDTHDRLPAARAAVELLRGLGCEFLIHCGDVGSGQIIDALAGAPVAFVFGNNDYDRGGMALYAKVIGVQCLGASGRLELGGKIFFVTHGDDGKLLKKTLDNQDCDYLLLGHTHVRHDQRIGRIRVINPGALYRATVKSVATLDTASDLLSFHTIA